MVYFVGETLRLPVEKAKKATPKAKSKHGLCVGWVDNTKECRERLFSVYRRGDLTGRANDLVTGYGVEVVHAGNTWRALPQISQKNFWGENTDKESDNTGLVLSILSQLYLLNQSSDFLEAPENLLLQ